MCRCPITKSSKRVLDLTGMVVSTISAGEGFVFAGSNSGQYVYKRVDGYRIGGLQGQQDGGYVLLSGEEREDEEACIRRGTITQDPQGITNHVRIIEGRYGGLY
jgi:hypothetical protein